MADEKTEVLQDAEADAAFAEGFTTTEPTPAAPVPTDAAPADTGTPPPADDAAKEPPPAAPKYVQITKAQFDAFEAAAAKVGDFDKKFDKAFGNVGSMQAILKELQASTPKGEAVVLDDAMFADMAEDYPDLAKHQRAILEKVLKGAVGTGARTASVAPAEVNRLVAEGVKTAQIEALEDEYPDWRDIVGAGQLSEAIADLDLAIRYSPASIKAYINRAIAKAMVKDYPGALADLDWVLAREKNGEAYLNRGILENELKKYTEAIPDFQEAIKLNGSCSACYYSMGKAYYYMKGYQEAIKSLSTCIAINPSDGNAYYYRALSYMETGKRDSSCSDLEQANKLGVKNAGPVLEKYCRR